MFSASKDLSAMGRGAAQASASGNDYRVVLPRLPTGKLVVDSVFLHADLAGRPYRVQDFRDDLRDIIDLKEISSIDKFQMSHVWMVTCKSTLTKTKLVTRGEFFVKSRRCLAINPEPTEMKLKLMWLPECLEDAYVCEALQAFGKVKTISQESWKVADIEQMRTLNRDVVLSLADGVRIADIPHILVVCGVQSLVLIPGRPPLCLRCSKVEHIRRNCRTPRCDNCRRFGHSAEDCVMTYANKLRQHTKQPDDNLQEHIMDATEVLDATGDTPSMLYAAAQVGVPMKSAVALTHKDAEDPPVQDIDSGLDAAESSSPACAAAPQQLFHHGAVSEDDMQVSTDAAILKRRASSSSDSSKGSDPASVTRESRRRRKSMPKGKCRRSRSRRSGGGSREASAPTLGTDQVGR
ncbi:uncharacterized protein LOC119164683 [Rhipicephalus microplus]|uniref:uncharacterized protein LOC119164683 n=1 Tax=Rhipicephalus microplus TaxID=6941 RepID=UPI003F6C10CE